MPVNIKINDNKEDGISNGMKIGIGVTLGTVGLVAVIVAIIILRRRKMKQNDFDNESVEVLENAGSTVVTANPLISMMIRLKIHSLQMLHSQKLYQIHH